MTHRRGRTRLLLHAQKERVFHLRRNAQIVAHDFDRDLTTEHGVLRKEHSPHSALPEQTDDVVASYPFGEIHDSSHIMITHEKTLFRSEIRD